MQRLEDITLERELASAGPDGTTRQRAFDALQAFIAGMRLLAWSLDCCRKAEPGHGSRELILPLGSAGQVVLFEIAGDEGVAGAVQQQREEDYRH